MLQSYLPASVAILFGLGFAGLFLAGAILLGPKRDTAEKLSPFECGSEPIGSPRVRFSVKFYQVAILYRDLSCTGTLVDNVCRDGKVTGFGFLEMGTFILVLAIALTYVWRKKAIGWD
jgi:NADH-quinone oxidoreductase subunit A